ncbi:YbjQ family protein [bacterium]|nr:YbjQ family protein [bacterium]MBP9808510.1 YbjQ family protein [bacterium]
MKISRLSLSILGSAFIAFAFANSALAQNHSLAQAQPSGGYPGEQGQPAYGQPATQAAAPYASERAVRAPQASLPIAAGIIVTTTLNVDGYRIREYKGIVRGAMVREPTIGQNFKAGFQGMFGGKIGAYVTMCEQGRQQSYDTMVAKAQALGANAIVGVQYDSNSFSTDSNQFATEVVCYGTAVVIEPAR